MWTFLRGAKAKLFDIGWKLVYKLRLEEAQSRSTKIKWSPAWEIFLSFW